RRADEIEPAYGRAILRPARHRAVEEKLIEGQLALKDVAFGQTDLALDITGRAHLGMQHAPPEAGADALDLVEDGIAERIPRPIVPVFGRSDPVSFKRIGRVLDKQ